jgi:hypothetical protein
MRTRRRNYYGRDHYEDSRREARRSRPEWMEDEPTGRDYQNDDVRDDRFSHGYHNRDYNRKNFWPDRYDREDHFNENEPTGYFDSGYERHGRKTYGYGNENSQFAEDFDNMSRGSEGRRKNNGHYEYSDKYYYNPNDYDQNDSRKNSYSDHYNDYEDNSRAYYYPGEGQNYGYGGYQSYPAYRRRDGYDNYRRRYADEGSDFIVDQDEYGRRRRPNIRDRIYW